MKRPHCCWDVFRYQAVAQFARGARPYYDVYFVRAIEILEGATIFAVPPAPSVSTDRLRHNSESADDAGTCTSRFRVNPIGDHFHATPDRF